MAAPRRARAGLAALLAAAGLAGCSPESEPPPNEAAPADGAAAVPPASAVKAPPSADATAAASEAVPAARPAAAAVPGAEPARRCGWIVNPTPGNWWLSDRDGEWILASQGSEPAPGMDDMPDMSASGWVETNGHYGYGCACVTLAYDPASRRVTKVADFRPKPLKLCRDDKRLPRPLN